MKSSVATIAMVFAACAACSGLEAIFPSPGSPLDGGQFQWDAGFDIMDWNDDGMPDIYAHDAGSIGRGAAYLNEGTRAAPRFTHGIGYDYNSTETTPQTIEHVSARANCDLNHDGLQDWIFFDGQLRFCPNTGTRHAPFHWRMWSNSPALFPGTPAMIKENSRFSTGPESMYWKRGIFARQALTLTAADWDGDGLQDLLVCRMKQEAPGVRAVGGRELWGCWGRMATQLPVDPGAAAPDPRYLAPLKETPERGLYFYRNTGSRSMPLFDRGVELLTPDGRSIAAPNPVVADVDGDGVPDLLTCETEYRCNAFRVDWPTVPHVIWFRRAAAGDVAVLQQGQPLRDRNGRAVPAGTMARVADFRGTGAQDVFVMDGGLKGSIRWYPNAAASGRGFLLDDPVVLHGMDFARFAFTFQAHVVDWFGPGSRDLILHGITDNHCKWGLRRTALYRNMKRPGSGLRYEMVGWLNFKGDPSMVPSSVEDRHYEAYGSAVSAFPADGSGRRRLMMSVGGKVFFFADLDRDGLTFRTRRQMRVPNVSNRHTGWQDIPVSVPFKVKAIRLNNDRNGTGNLHESYLSVESFEAFSGEKNVATTGRVTVATPAGGESRGKQLIRRPWNMLTPGMTNTATECRATVFGFASLAAEIAWAEPVALDRIRFLIAPRDAMWFNSLVPFYWQGKLFRAGMEEGENWQQYKVDLSPDGVTWTNLVNRMTTEMLTCHPRMVDWDDDGRTDMLLGYTTANGIYPAYKQYRLYRNIGSNDDPAFAEPVAASTTNGVPIQVRAAWIVTYGAQCGVVPADLDADGRSDLVVEGPEGELLAYRNVSSNGLGFTFQPMGSLDTGAGKFVPGGGYWYFDYTDADGDGVPDVLCSAGTAVFYRGVRTAAPARVTDMTVSVAGHSGSTLQWSRPPQAVGYDVRWTPGRELCEADWGGLAGITGVYSAARGVLERAVLTGLPAGRELAFAVRSVDAGGRVSAMSPAVHGAVPPLLPMTLYNGIAADGAGAAYAGCDAVTLDSQHPAAPAVTNRASLSLKCRPMKVVLVSFSGLPQAAIRRAELQMFTWSAQPFLISCSAVRADWDSATVTWDEPAPGIKWAAGELDRGGVFQSFCRPMFTPGLPTRVCWDVTPAVRASQRSGGRTVSLVLRVEDSGHYSSGYGQTFMGPYDRDLRHRPRLMWEFGSGQ